MTKLSDESSNTSNKPLNSSFNNNIKPFLPKVFLIGLLLTCSGIILKDIEKHPGRELIPAFLLGIAGTLVVQWISPENKIKSKEEINTSSRKSFLGRVVNKDKNDNNNPKKIDSSESTTRTRTSINFSFPGIQGRFLDNVGVFAFFVVASFLGISFSIEQAHTNLDKSEITINPRQNLLNIFDNEANPIKLIINQDKVNKRELDFNSNNSQKFLNNCRDGKGICESRLEKLNAKIKNDLNKENALLCNEDFHRLKIEIFNTKKILTTGSPAEVLLGHYDRNFCPPGRENSIWLAKEKFEALNLSSQPNENIVTISVQPLRLDASARIEVYK